MFTVLSIYIGTMHKILVVLSIINLSFFFSPKAPCQQNPESSRSWEVFTDLKPRPNDEKPPALFSNSTLLEAFVDEHVGAKLEEAHIPGAVFLAIKDSHVLLKKSYGITNLDSREPVDPDKTMFYIASISKTFIGTTVMRLVDKGLFALNDEIAAIAPSIELDRYTRYDEPVTLRHSLTHSTGFRDIFLNSSAPNRAKQEQMRDALRNYLTKQGARPGEYTNYCNAGISMAASALEDATGKLYADVLQEEVFDPLGMAYAMLDAPGNDRKNAFKDNLVTPYIYDSKTDSYLTQTPFIRNLYATGGIAASATSITNYMLMHMNKGRHKGVAFLSPESHQEMHTHQGSNHPLIPGYRLSFKEGIRNGVAYHGHSGDYRGNDSTMMFVMDYNFGFFLSYTGDNNTFYRDFINNLFDTAFTRQKETVTATTLNEDDLKEYEGTYTNFRYDEPTSIQLIWPLFGQFEVYADPDGLLRVEFPSFYFKGSTVRFVKVGDDLFRKVEPGEPGRIGDLLVDYLVFKRDDNGQPKAFASSIQNHSFTMTRVAAWAKSSNFKLLLSFARYGMVVIIIAGVLIWLGRVGIHFLYKRKLNNPFAVNTAFLASVLSAAAGLNFLFVFFQTLTSTLPINLTYGFDDLGLTPYFTLPIISVVFFIITAVLFLSPKRFKNTNMVLCLVIFVSLAPLIVWVFIAIQTNLLSFYF